MKTELQKQLLNKYPEFFAHTKNKIYVGENVIEKEVAELIAQKEIVEPIQFGFECGSGWHMLIDELFGEIRNHIENENIHRQNTLVPIFWKLQYWLRRHKKTRPLGDWVYEHAPRKKYKPLVVNITQIKEKFGGLCVYYSGGDDYVFALTMFADSLSRRICETCGTTMNVGKTEGWIYTCCWDCLEKNPRAKNLKWISNESL